MKRRVSGQGECVTGQPGVFEQMNTIDREFFGNDPQQWPARTTVEARLPRGEFLLEIECVAAL